MFFFPLIFRENEVSGGGEKREEVKPATQVHTCFDWLPNDGLLPRTTAWPRGVLTAAMLAGRARLCSLSVAVFQPRLDLTLTQETSFAGCLTAAVSYTVRLSHKYV